MADFRTHISVSTAAGILYGMGGYQAGLAWESCVLGTALCSVSGMLPDLDSDSGIPLREAVAFSSAFVPMLMVDRLQRLGCNHEMMLLITVGIYFMLRFGIAEAFRRYTVHRGMWHSIPAAFIACLFAFVASSCVDMNLRLFKTVAVFVGFMSHIFSLRSCVGFGHARSLLSAITQHKFGLQSFLGFGLARSHPSASCLIAFSVKISPAPGYARNLLS